jgi:glutaredoxin
MKNILVATFAFLLFACEGTNKGNQSNVTSNPNAEVAQKSIVIYGSNQCSHCMDFKAKLDSIGLIYTFNDVDMSDQYYNEMRNIIQSAGVTGRVSFPIVLVDGQELFIAPEIGEFVQSVM